MKSEKFEIWVMDYLSNVLDEDGQIEFKNFLENHPEYQDEFSDLQLTWNQIDSLEVPEPSEKMDEQFYEVLSEHMQKQEKTNENLLSHFQAFLESLWKPRLAYGMILLLIGLGIGYYMNSSNKIEPTKTTIVSNKETEEVREKLVLTLLEQPSANKRLQGVSEANKFEKVDEEVIKALLKTLNNDPNVNVRLAAIESLTNYIDDPMVREGLVQSIVQQESPMVQITLANLMVALQEKRSIEPFKKLMRSKEQNSSVKQKLENSIQQII